MVPLLTHLAPDGRRLVVGAAILRGEGADVELLAARRIEPAELAGGWELPGGKVDPGEGPQEALRRELVEELGIEVELGPEVPGPDDGIWPLGTDYAMRVFQARLPAGVEPVPLEQHDALVWVALRDWRGIDWLNGDVGPVAAVVAMLGTDDGP